MRGDGVVDRQELARAGTVSRLGCRCSSRSPPGWRSRTRRRRRAAAERRLHPRRRPRLRRPLVLRRDRPRDAEHRPPRARGHALHRLLRGRQHLLAVARGAADRALSAALRRERRALPRHARRAARRARSRSPRCCATPAIAPRWSESGTSATGTSSCPGTTASTSSSACAQQRRGELLRLRRPPAACPRRSTSRG